MSLRLKLLLGFIIPSVMILVAGIWSSSQMRSLGRRVQAMLDENERSVQYTVKMNEALERLDSGVLLRLHGDGASYQAIYKVSTMDLLRALNDEQENITIPTEKEMVDTLATLIDAYLLALDSSGSAAPGNLDFYRVSMAPLFKRLKVVISDVRMLNSKAMYESSKLVASRAERAALPADLIIFAAVIFAMLFAWLTQLYVVAPTRLLLDAVKEWHLRGRFTPPRFESRDELNEMKEFLNMISLKSDEGQ